MIVYHCFEKPEKLELPVNGGWELERTLYDTDIAISDKIVIDENKEFFGNVVLLKRQVHKK